MKNPARAHLVISGRVQGVNYRAFTRSTGQRLGLRGWVKNLADGTVEAVFEGERSSIEEAIRQCYQGPPVGNVTNIETDWEDYRGEFDSFLIVY